VVVVETILLERRGWVDNGARVRDDVCNVRGSVVLKAGGDARQLGVMLWEGFVGRGSTPVTGSCRLKYDPGRDGVANQRLLTYPEYTARRWDVAGPDLANRLKVIDKEVMRAGSQSVQAEVEVAGRSSSKTSAVWDGRI